MAIVVGLPIFFGTGYPADRLPAGWTLNEQPSEWAVGISPDGRRFLLSTTDAYPIEGHRGNIAGIGSPIALADLRETAQNGTQDGSAP